MLRKTWLFLIAWGFWPILAQAESSLPECYGNDLALQIRGKADLSRPLKFAHYLASRNSAGAFMTYARVQMAASDDFSTEQAWNAVVRFDFPLPKNQVSLPYNIYGLGVEVAAVGGGFSYFHDFTENCTAAGLGLYPGQNFDLKGLLLPRTPEDAPRQTLQVNVWGRL